MVKYFCFLWFLCFSWQAAFAQGTALHTLSVPQYKETSAQGLLLKASHAAPDTGKVWLLYKAAAIYWWRQKSKADLDSCLDYAAQARALSISLHYKDGQGEATFLMCKVLVNARNMTALGKLINSVDPNQRMRILLSVGDYFLYLTGDKTSNARQAYPYLSKASALSKQYHNQHWQLESEIAIGKYYFVIGNLPLAIRHFMLVINYWHQQGNLSEEARWWGELGHFMPDLSLTGTNSLVYLRRSFNLYAQLQDKVNMGYIAADIADVYNYNFNELDSAKRYYLQSIMFLKQARVSKLYRYYMHLADAFQKKGNFNQALSFSLAALYNMEQLQDERKKGMLYEGIGQIYSELGDHANSLKYFKLALSDLNFVGSRTIYMLGKHITDNLLMLGRPREALAFISRFKKQHDMANATERETVWAAEGNCYAALQQYDTAEQLYLQMIDFEKQAGNDGGVNRQSLSVSGPEAYYIIGNFYVTQKRYNEAEVYLRKFEAFDNKFPLLQQKVALLQFKVDSAAQRYLPAITHYQRYTAYKDSMFKVENIGKMADMQVQYETRQKEKDIRLLQNRMQLQQRSISQARQTRNFTYGGIFMLSLVLGIGYNRYRLKQRSYRLLEQAKQQVNVQNGDLQVLNYKLQKLVAEKEWLVKEIHHRVKNNLQMMQSLLKSQQHYISQETAAQAIQTSQHRLQAMSLVHQKLYMNNAAGTIDMYDYSYELLNYLKNSFEIRQRIGLEMKVDKFFLDIIQAVPLGLIINEAVTNAIKYAFPDDSAGLISISLGQSGSQVILEISDNGVGMPEEVLAAERSSFGITLIRGLAIQLEGELLLSTAQGTTVKVCFEVLPNQQD